MNDNKVRISEAAQILGVSGQTLRNWEKSGKLQAHRSPGNQRYYSLIDLKKFALDIKALGLVWATSEIPPDLTDEYYCERPDRFTSRAQKMAINLQQAGKFSNDLVSLITLVASEIGDNSFAHNVGNWPDIPGIFYAFDLNKKTIVIADRGRGVKATLRQVRPSIDNDLEALRVAFTEILSGRNPEKRGNGLKVVRKTLESREIGLIFRSGIGVVTVPTKKPGTLTIAMSDQNVRGTYCVITF
ncbi:MAG: helix-turn-helix domain-containing protein [Candidatus Komeilibacteria bacterium]|nr:helix-turn-helix domain-containing protein [Candidatus Komeilibacteria bacterium]